MLRSPLSLVVVTECPDAAVVPALLAGVDAVHLSSVGPLDARGSFVSAPLPDLLVLEVDDPTRLARVDDVLASAPGVGALLVADLDPDDAVALVGRGIDDVLPRTGLVAADLARAVRHTVARRRRRDVAHVPRARHDGHEADVAPDRAEPSSEEADLERLIRMLPHPMGVGDLAYQERVERALEESTARLDAVVALSPSAIIIEQDGRVVAANAAACALTGAVDVDPDSPDLLALGASARRGGVSGRPAAGHRLETKLRFRDGRERWVEVATAPIRHGGRDASLVCALDVTDRRSLHDNPAPRARQDAVGRLAGGIAHDFNNLLQVVSGHVERLTEDLPSGDPLRDSVDAIGAAADRAAALTEQLLAVGRRQVLLPKSVDLNELVGRFLTRQSPRLPAGVHVHLVTANDLPPVRIDATRLEQALTHLVSNACDAMPRGGDLTVTTRMGRVEGEPGPTGVEPGGVDPGAWVSVDVSDTGHGMTADVLAQAFEPFFTTKRNAPGAGLGMSTVYGIIKQSGGHVAGESVLGEGTRWSLYLPSAQPLVTAADVVSAPSAGVRVLLVEDEDAVRVTLVEWLERDRIDVTAVASAEEALAVHALGSYDVLVTDVGLPRVSGPALARDILAAAPSTRIIFISGYVADSVDRSEFGARAEFLQKPFNPRELVRRVRGVTAGAGLLF